jgi:hypothetical protein
VKEPRPGIYGLLAEFHSPEEIVKAAEGVHAAGYRIVDAYTPYPMEEVLDALHLHETHVPKLALTGGLVGLVGGWGLQYWASVIEYPMNIGGRPLASWTTFIVPSYELTILFASLTAAIGMAALSGLPQPYHPVFNVERFSMASSDKFFLVIESTDAKFGNAADFLRGLGAKGVYDVAE